MQKVGQALTRELWAELETEEKARGEGLFRLIFGTRRKYEPIVCHRKCITNFTEIFSCKSLAKSLQTYVDHLAPGS